MNAAQVWELFEKTGNVGVYMLYKKLKEQAGSAAEGKTETYAGSDAGNHYSGNTGRRK